MGLRHVLFSALLVGVLVVSAQAGFTSFLCEFPSEATHTHTWTFYTDAAHCPAGCGFVGFLDLDESCTGYGTDWVDMLGTTSEDPTFHVQKTIDNDTTFTWTSYELTLQGNATFLPGAFSDMFATVSYPTNQWIIFSAPTAVEPGGSVTLDVDINVPTTGGFNFTMTQLAVPEPATLSLLALGAGILFRRK